MGQLAMQKTPFASDAEDPLTRLAALPKMRQNADAFQLAELLHVDAAGLLVVRLQSGDQAVCQCLEGALVNPARGDSLLVCGLGNGISVVLGRVGPCLEKPPELHLTLEATESLTLKCGEASIDLRADGKVMVRGEDVLLRAKGTQRIRAGNVAIN